MRGARWSALGTTVHLLVVDDAALERAAALLRQALHEVDLACSRFRADSELRRLRPGRQRVSGTLAGAVRAALQAAADTDGLVDPTLGAHLSALGYDRTFSALPADGPAAVPVLPTPARWREIRCEGEVLELPADVDLDLGATAKAWAADRSAELIADLLGTGVLVNLGGDLAVAGPGLHGGWPVDATGDVVTLESGGMATSSTVDRTWRRGGAVLHHVVDPRTGCPATGHWATVTVLGGGALQANTASTAAVVLGAEAPAWLAEHGLPSRLVGRDGGAVHVGGWPDEVAA